MWISEYVLAGFLVVLPENDDKKNTENRIV